MSASHVLQHQARRPGCEGAQSRTRAKARFRSAVAAHRLTPKGFRRAAGILALPVPVSGGSIESLTSFLNITTRSDFVLVVAWLLAALRHGGPYPLLAARP